MKKFITLAIAALGLSSVAQAAPIGPAGCGLGNLILGKDNQIFAATTNGTGSQIFGITSGTSNCVDRAGDSAMIIQYIDVNRVALSKDAARGEGETITALSRMMGCQDSRALGTSMKSNYGTLFPSMDAQATEISSGLKRLVNEEPSLASTCQPIG